MSVLPPALAILWVPDMVEPLQGALPWGGQIPPGRGEHPSNCVLIHNKNSVLCVIVSTRSIRTELIVI